MYSTFIFNACQLVLLFLAGEYIPLSRYPVGMSNVRKTLGIEGQGYFQTSPANSLLLKGRIGARLLYLCYGDKSNT